MLSPQDHIVPRKCKYMLCHPSGSYLLGIQKGLLLLKYLQTFCSCIHKIPDPKNLCLPDKLVNLLLQDLHFFDRPMNRKIQSIYLFMDLTLHLTRFNSTLRFLLLNVYASLLFSGSVNLNRLEIKHDH